MAKIISSHGTVFGKITNAKGQPLANLKVAIYDVDMREWQLLSETDTDRTGKYTLRWHHSQLSGRGKNEADIAVRIFIKDAETILYQSSMKEVRFNASEREEINIAIEQELSKETTEFDQLVQELTFLAGKVSISELQENKAHQDITFLSKEMNVSAAKIEHLCVAHRLENTTKIHAAFFYALFRKNTLLQSDFPKRMNSRIAIGLNVNHEVLLFDIALTEEERITNGIRAAISEKIIDESEEKNTSRNLKMLAQYRERATAFYENEYPEKFTETLSSLFAADKIEKVKEFFKENKNDLGYFFEQIMSPSFFTASKNTAKDRTTAELGKILGLNSEVIPAVAKAKNIKKPEDIKLLTRLNKAEWVETITKSNPEIKDENMINTYASNIVRRLEQAWPTLAFAAQLERNQTPALLNRDKIVSFFHKHPDFDLTKDNIDLYLKHKKLSAKDTEAITEELKSVQRVFQIVPNYSKTMALRLEKIHSAQSIVAIGSSRFINEIAPKAGIEAKEARDIYQKAESRHTAALMMLGRLQDAMGAVGIASFETRSLSKKLEAVSKDFPNLKALFKGIDTCECEHCRSVYSPAAYMVELLQFLDKRTVKANNAKSILFNRRADLGEIDLGCANANTPVKYIDLVCEILEEAIAPHIMYSGPLVNTPSNGTISPNLKNELNTKGIRISEKALMLGTETLSGLITAPYYLRDSHLVYKIEKDSGIYNIYQLRQTFGSAEELDAAPEYVNDAAYQQLSESTFAFSLPFNLAHTEANAYFSRFDLNRAELAQAFQKLNNPTDDGIAAIRLGLAKEDQHLITHRPNPNNEAAQQAFWNAPTQWEDKDSTGSSIMVSGNVTDYLKNVNYFLDKTGLQYKELDTLLKLKFIDINNDLFIKHEDLSCDTERKSIAHLDLGTLDRIHRFLRLQKKTGWKPELLDEIIAQPNLGNKNLDDDCLIKAAQLKEITIKINVKIEELIGCFGNMPHILLQEDMKPLYQQVFLNKAKNSIIHPAFLPENMNGLQDLDDFSNYIATCLGLRPKDFTVLLQLLPDNKLSYFNLSLLFAATKLSQQLKYKAEELVIINEMSGIKFWNSPKDMLAFIAIAQDVKSSPLEVSDLQFLLHHEAVNLTERVISIAKIDEFLHTLKNKYAEIDTQLTSPFNNALTASEQLETLTATLLSLKSLQEDEVNTIVNFLSKNWTSAAEAKTLISTKLGSDIGNAAINSIHLAIDTLDALPAGANTESEQKSLLKALLDGLAPFLIQQSKVAFLSATLASAFRIDTGLIDVVLQYARLKYPVTGASLIAVILTSTISVANQAQQSAALQLLHKMLPLLGAFKLSKVEAEWHFKNNAGLGWLTFDSIPYGAAGEMVVDLQDYIHYLKAIGFSKQFTPLADPLNTARQISFFSLMEMLLPTASPTRSGFIKDLSLLLGYDEKLVDDLDAYLFTNISDYQKTDNLEQLLRCLEYCRKLDADAIRIQQYCKTTLTVQETSKLRTILKSRYDDSTWLSTLKEIMDAIRPQKRDAMVAYLLATHPEIKDTNGLYDYFLIDVEMESKMPSSRIVLAHNSIQLFVQRCLMGLEPDAIADVKNDIGWEQWKWMKSYRVWEANRKIFLYPENWYDVSLTDDKTYLLSEFINEIQQNELTNDTAEQAIGNYLEKLDNIAFLEVMATWYEVPRRTMHIFARTKGGDPATYYYRKFINENKWTPWEKVELDITGDHLITFVRNNRLHLAWPVFTEEPRIDQDAKIPNSNDQENGSTRIEKPQRKLKIQLAISEYSNKKWQPKKTSKDALFNPEGWNNYSNDDTDFDRSVYSLKYIAWPKIENFPVNEVVGLFKEGYFSGADKDYEQSLRGVFNIAGCKGYPELLDLNKIFGKIKGGLSLPFGLPDLLPDFEHTEFLNQKYEDQYELQANPLNTRNGISLLKSAEFLNLLQATPGIFRISFPHQFTIIDVVAQLIQMVFNTANASGTAQMEMFQGISRNALHKIPQGTLLPYFKEDSNHAYVVIPGYYKTEKGEGLIENSEKRTASNVLQLFDDIINWYKKITPAIEAINEEIKQKLEQASEEEQKIIRKDGFIQIVQLIVSDTGFQKLLTEVNKYVNVDSVLRLLARFNKDEATQVFLKELFNTPQMQYGEQFKNLYHPLVCYLRSKFYQGGTPELMNRDTQLHNTGFSFQNYYKPNNQNVPKALIKKEGTNGVIQEEWSYPVEDVDFSSDGSYRDYNWDLFYRLPLHIATSLTRNQRFEEALSWFHYMFNPTGALSGNGVQKYWVTKPFYLNQEEDYIAQRIDEILYNPTAATGASDAEKDKLNEAIESLKSAVADWRSSPFRPDVVMRTRPVAYQKALLMKYIDNLTEWGDHLFRQDTMESIAQATQMYILADKLLGPKPRVVIPAVKQPYETYNQIEAKLDSFGNALIGLENILPDISALPEQGAELPPPVTLSLLYFCIPGNEQMAEYWDRVADRLFKIRHSQNIDGLERSLSLFAPPIDPGMLVRAAAAGLDISSVLAGLNAPSPFYRFNILAQKATELAQEVRGLGSALLQALEKKDAEAFSLLRSELELKVLNATTGIKKLQIKEAKEQIEVLNRTRKVTEERQQYYKDIEFMNALEITSLVMNGVSAVAFTIGSVMEMAAGAAVHVPEVNLGASGFGGSPHAVLKVTGGEKIAASISSFGKALILGSQVVDKIAGGISTVANYQRRYDDWKLQERLATKELASIDKQIAAAEIRQEIAETDLKNHELQIENANKTDEFMRSKFTNKELYDWMLGQISAVYFKSYQLAHDFARKAERCYRFELGNDDGFISYGYWDSMKKGLQCADQLVHDIKRMETSYLDKNRREYEITKHVSLVQLDPLALMRLRATGVCDFDIPEALYDMDHPGQYFRRLKSVSISIPCIAGPHTSVSSKLSLVNNRYRKNTSNPANYAEESGNDARFEYNIGAIQSIATSQAQNDSGVFELNFRDERYLPFENTGAISSWRLELPTALPQFDYNTIADIVLHIKYTAREGGSVLKNEVNKSLKARIDAVKQDLAQEGLHVALNMKHDLPNEWHLLKKNGSATIKLSKERLPYFAQTPDRNIEEVIFLVRVAGNTSTLTITPDNADPIGITLGNSGISGLLKGSNTDIMLEESFKLSIAVADLEKMEECIIIVKYTF